MTTFYDVLSDSMKCAHACKFPVSCYEFLNPFVRGSGLFVHMCLHRLTHTANDFPRYSLNHRPGQWNTMVTHVKKVADQRSFIIV